MRIGKDSDLFCCMYILPCFLFQDSRKNCLDSTYIFRGLKSLKEASWKFIKRDFSAKDVIRMRAQHYFMKIIATTEILNDWNFTAEGAGLGGEGSLRTSFPGRIFFCKWHAPPRLLGHCSTLGSIKFFFPRLWLFNIQLLREFIYCCESWINYCILVFNGLVNFQRNINEYK